MKVLNATMTWNVKPMYVKTRNVFTRISVRNVTKVINAQLATV